MTRNHRHQIYRRQLTVLLGLLPFLTSGSFMVSVNSLSMLTVNAESRSISVQAAGIKESGLRPAEVLVGRRNERSLRKLLTVSEYMARSLSAVGWTFTLYDGDRGLLRMGSRVSRLTGHIRANPLTLRKLLQTL